jgi:hypothetical protein
LFVGKCSGDKWCCKGQCEQGEGDCDNHSDCLPGLKCDFDGWFGTDFCKAGMSFAQSLYSFLLYH